MFFRELPILWGLRLHVNQLRLLSRLKNGFCYILVSADLALRGLNYLALQLIQWCDQQGHHENDQVIGSYLLQLELTALQTEGRGEIVSTPRIITSNQKEARIEQGVEIPFQESASSGATTTQFKKAVLSLTVTPQITPDDKIIMDLLVSKDNVGQLTPSATGGAVPSIDTRSVETQVLVSDGQTVVLGGIYETSRREIVSKVPFLGDIPGLGVLFRSTTNTADKAELLIFVTPRILEEGSNIY